METPPRRGPIQAPDAIRKALTIDRKRIPLFASQVISGRYKVIEMLGQG
jgi:hypothetical protein